jgi:Glycosyltransferase family 87
MKKIWYGLLVCGALYLLVNLKSVEGQWDFDACYHTTKAYLGGVNPYDNSAVARFTHRTIMAFAYMPGTIWFFVPFTWFDYKIAVYLYILLKLAVIAVLLMLWRNVFFDRQAGPVFYLICLLGFNCTFGIDLQSGNIALFEQFLLWSAFFYYLRRKLLYFCLFVVLAATLKVEPILFLFLLLPLENKYRYRYLVWSGCAFFVVVWVQFMVNPSRFAGFLQNAAGVVDDGSISTFACVQDTAAHLFTSPIITPWLNKLAFAIYLGVIAFVVALSIPVFRTIKKTVLVDQEKLYIFFGCVVYALVCFRLKDYTFIFLIPSAFFIVQYFLRRNRLAGWFVIVCLLFNSAYLLDHNFGPGLLLCYYPLFLLYGLWVAYLFWRCELLLKNK